MVTFSEMKYRYDHVALPAKTAFWFTVMSVIQKGIQFLITPIYTKLLTADEYGYYSIYVTWYSILMIFATLNLNAGGFNNGMLKYKDDREGFVCSMQGLGNVTTIIVFGIIFLFHSFVTKFTGLDIIVYGAMFIMLLFNPAFGIWSQYQRYTFGYRSLSVWTIAYALVSSFLSVAFIFIVLPKKYAVVMGTITAQIIFGLIFYIRNLIRGKKFFQKEYWYFALKFNLPLVPHYLSAIILGSADKVMINTYCGESEVGIYSLSYTVALMLNIITVAISQAYSPWAYRKMEQKEYEPLRKVVNEILLLLGMIDIFCILIAPELVQFLGTDVYMRAVWVIPPVMLSCYFIMIYSFFSNVEFYYEKKISVMLISIIGAAVNIVLNVVFIPAFGFIVAGYTTFASYLLMAFLHYKIMVKFCGESTRRMFDMKFLIGFSMFITVCSLSMSAVYHLKCLRYFLIILLIIVGIIVGKNKISKYV